MGDPPVVVGVRGGCISPVGFQTLNLIPEPGEPLGVHIPGSESHLYKWYVWFQTVDDYGRSPTGDISPGTGETVYR